ncbi:MAG: ABC transporter ATP-binding protein [Verrucomicrobiota bacterium]
MTEELEVEQLSVNYGAVVALEDVSFRLASHRLVALLGRNGSGKTTLLKALSGLIRPHAGRLIWAGTPVVGTKARMAYLPQRDAVDWNFPITVRGVVEMGRFPFVGWFGTFGPNDVKQVDRALDQMQMTDLQNRRISELSGGQQQRAFIARALAQEADVFLFDEVFNGLDAPTQDNLAGLLRHLAEGGKLIIVSHHDLKTIHDYFDDALVLDRRLVYCGNVGEAQFSDRLKEAGLHG